MKSNAPFDPALFSIQTLSNPESRAYLLEWLSRGLEMSQLVRDQIETLDGRIEVLVPKGTPLERAYDLNRGGDWIDVRDKYPQHIKPHLDYFVIPYVVDYLVQLPTHALFCEEPYQRRSESPYAFSHYSDDALKTFYQQTMYYVVSPVLGVEKISEAVKNAILDSDGFTQTLTLSHLDVRPALTRGELIYDEMKLVAKNVQAAFVQAYDFESWLMWRRSRSS